MSSQSKPGLVFPPGTAAVFGEHDHPALVMRYNEADWQYNLLHMDEDGKWMTSWIDWGDVRPDTTAHPLRFPGQQNESVTAENIFVVECETENGPSIELFAAPTAVEAAYPEVPDLRIRLMEAIADPGEKFEMDGTYYVSFRSVQGELSK